MNVDVVKRNQDLRRYHQKSSFDLFFWITFFLLTIVVMSIYHKEVASGQSDIYIHANLASEFNFLDLHSITSRIAYPFWHFNFSVLYQLGVPFVWAATLVCVLYKVLGFMLVQRIIYLYLLPDDSTKLATLSALLIMFVTAVRIPSLNPSVYIGIGSPTVWHNPTQIVAILSSLLCVFYTAHVVILYFDLKEANPFHTLPWIKIVVLAIILLFSAVCKPTFLQAYLPAAALYFLILWIQNPKHTRFFLQIILAFLPAGLFFIMQYLYYTGVVVPFTSGVAAAFDPSQVWIAIRNMLMMAAFPLFVLLFTTKKKDWKEPTFVLCILIAGISIIEAAVFSETGVRENHGNFNWASMNAAFLLWVISLPRLITAVSRFQYDRAFLLKNAKEGTLSSNAIATERKRLNLQSVALLVSIILLLWHVYSGFYYLHYLYTTGSVF